MLRVCALSELPPGTSIRVDGPVPVAVFHADEATTCLPAQKPARTHQVSGTDGVVWVHREARDVA